MTGLQVSTGEETSLATGAGYYNITVREVSQVVGDWDGLVVEEWFGVFGRVINDVGGPFRNPVRMEEEKYWDAEMRKEEYRRKGGDWCRLVLLPGWSK